MKLYTSILFSSTALTASVVNAQSFYPDPVQTYFVPLPEPQLDDCFKTLSSKAKGPISTLISIAIAADNTFIYYDHWEDGFEAEAKDKTQSSTQIWGDGDPSNGAPPGHPEDTLMRGEIIYLVNDVSLPRNPSTYLYDGRDRIESSLPIVVVRSAFPDKPGPLMAGAVEVFNTDQWGTRFIAPVGVDTANLSGTWPFELTKFFIIAGSDNTDIIRNGVVVSFLNTGESEAFTVNQGDLITSTRPIQVHLLTGDTGDSYELRWYALASVDDWTNEYISPVAETLGNTGFWFYNPSAFPIAIDFSGDNTFSGSFNVAGNSEGFIETCTTGSNCILVGNTDQQFGNKYSGVRFSSSDGPFYGLVQVDADGRGRIFDWGFPMIPTAQLTSQVLVGLGIGCSGDCMPLNNVGTNERSVVWVTPISDATIYVDYDADGVFDANYIATALSSLRLVSPTRNDMSGAFIAGVAGSPNAMGQPDSNNSPVRIAVAWGQDPPRSLFNDGEGLDLGTAVLPLANPYVHKAVESVTNPDGTVDPFKIVDQVGDIIKYQITVSNVGFTDIFNVVVTDPLIQNQVSPGVSTLNGPVEYFPSSTGILEYGETWIYTGSYTVTPLDISSNGGGDGLIENSVIVSTSQFPAVSVEVKTPII